MDGWITRCQVIFFEERKRNDGWQKRKKKHQVNERLRDNLNLKLKGIRGIRAWGGSGAWREIRGLNASSCLI